MEKTLYLKSRKIRKHTRRYMRGRAQNWADVFGCSTDELVKHLESQFKDGMTWENYGRYGWHIDHIEPLSKAKDMEDLLKRGHYTNLQPLWAEENLKKSNK